MKSAAPDRTAARLEFLVSMSESFDVIVVGYGLAGANALDVGS
jgi:hypothetical protein